MGGGGEGPKRPISGTVLVGVSLKGLARKSCKMTFLKLLLLGPSSLVGLSWRLVRLMSFQTSSMVFFLEFER